MSIVNKDALSICITTQLAYYIDMSDAAKPNIPDLSNSFQEWLDATYPVSSEQELKDHGIELVTAETTDTDVDCVEGDGALTREISFEAATILGNFHNDFLSRI